MQIKHLFATRKHLPVQFLLLLLTGTSRTKGLGAEVVGDILAGRSHTANYTFAAQSLFFCTRASKLTTHSQPPIQYPKFSIQRFSPLWIENVWCVWEICLYSNILFPCHYSSPKQQSTATVYIPFRYYKQCRNFKYAEDVHKLTHKGLAQAQICIYCVLGGDPGPIPVLLRGDSTLGVSHPQDSSPSSLRGPLSLISSSLGSCVGQLQTS